MSDILGILRSFEPRADNPRIFVTHALQATRDAALDEYDALRADLAKAQARCAELESALASIAVLDHGEDCPRRLGCDDSDEGEACAEHEPDGCPECDCTTGMAQTALASDGTSALASVRLAQRALDEVTGGAAIYGDGRLQDDMRAEILAAKAALAEAFGSGE